MPSNHQFVCRQSGQVLDEKLFSDGVVRFVYSQTRERAPWLFNALVGPSMSSLLGYFQFDVPFTARLLGNRDFLESVGVDLDECIADPKTLDTPRKVFERQIRYWECRPAPQDSGAVMAPADSRALFGSLQRTSALFTKGKFFEYEELLGSDKGRWLGEFHGGDYAIFRLTPDKYHYNHTPVSGWVEDTYEVDGTYHSCNPSAVVEVVTPYSKNKRSVTIVQTDVPGGSGVGLVAMIEVVALMIGEVTQCYSDRRYDDPHPALPGQMLRAGQPKSLFRPGSSTTVLLFQKGRVTFDGDLLRNQTNPGVASRFSEGFGCPLAETEMAVRAQIGRASVASAQPARSVAAETEAIPASGD